MPGDRESLYSTAQDDSATRNRMSDVSAVKLSYREMTTDDLGRIVSRETKQALRKQYGFCVTCTDIPVQIYSFKKSRLSPLWSSKKAINTEGESRDGLCLRCNPELRKANSKRNLVDAKNDSTRSLQSNLSMNSMHSGESGSKTGGSGHGGGGRSVSKRLSSTTHSTASTSMRDLGLSGGSGHSVYSSQSAYPSRNPSNSCSDGMMAAGNRSSSSLDLDRAHSSRFSDDGNNSVGRGSNRPQGTGPSAMRTSKHRSNPRAESARHLTSRMVGDSNHGSDHQRGTMDRSASVRSGLERNHSVRAQCLKSESSHRSLCIEEEEEFSRQPPGRTQSLNRSSSSLQGMTGGRGLGEREESFVGGRPGMSDRSQSFSRERPESFYGSTGQSQSSRGPDGFRLASNSSSRSLDASVDSHNSGYDLEQSLARRNKRRKPRSDQFSRRQLSQSDDEQDAQSVGSRRPSMGRSTDPPPARMSPRRSDSMERTDQRRGSFGQQSQRSGSLDSQWDDVHEELTKRLSSDEKDDQAEQDRNIINELQSFFADLRAGGASEVLAEAVTSAMGSHNDRESVQAFCLHTVRNSFNDNAVNSEALLSCGGHVTLLAAMKNFPSSFDVQEQGCAALDLLAVNPFCRKELMRLGAGGAVEHAIRSYPAEMSLVIYGFGALRSFSQGPTAGVLSQSGSVALAIATAMRSNPSFASIQQDGCELLGSVAHITAEQDTSVKREVLDVLVSAMEMHINNVAIVERACHALTAFVTDDKNLDLMARTDCIWEVLDKAADMDCRDARIVLERLELSLGHDESLEEQALEKLVSALSQPKEPHLVEDVLDTLKAFGWSQRLTVVCLKALRSLASSSEACEKKLRQHLTVDEIVGFIQAYRSDSEIQGEARALAGVLVGAEV